MILSCPGKTFLIGEYVALDGGPSLLLSTPPRFQLQVRARSSDVQNPWHPLSPAGVLFERHRDDLSRWEFSFTDPHAGLGGLGASSAQFALLYSFLNEWTKPVSWEAMLHEYRACAWKGEGVPPSGADVVSQLTGGVTYFDGRTFSVEKLEWPFTEMGFTLLRTGFKLATHEHLREGTLAPHSTLRTIVEEARKAFSSVDEIRLIEAVNACSLVLRQAGLTMPATADLLDQMRAQHDLFWAAKGCGAMGADIILCLHALSRADDVAAWARGRGLDVCGSNRALSNGIEVLQEQGR